MLTTENSQHASVSKMSTQQAAGSVAPFCHRHYQKSKTADPPLRLHYTHAHIRQPAMTVTAHPATTLLVHTTHPKLAAGTLWQQHCDNIPCTTSKTTPEDRRLPASQQLIT